MLVARHKRTGEHTCVEERHLAFVCLEKVLALIEPELGRLAELSVGVICESRSVIIRRRVEDVSYVSLLCSG